MFWFKRRKLERAEAERALRETREQTARAKEREKADRYLFERIEQIRKENHIAEAVGKLMEGR